MKLVIQSLLKGLAIILPLLITLEIVRWLLSTIEGSLAPLLQAVLNNDWYYPGMALISFLLLCTLVGFTARWRSFSWLWSLPGKILLKIPGASQIYGILQDLMELMSGKNFEEESVVIVKLPQSDVELIGIVTKKGGIKDDRMSSLMDDEQLAVFLPMAYNVGGYTIIVPKSCTRNIDMKPAEALQLVLSGGLGKSKAPKPTK
ncbi:DUF502 domain-containing protein [Aliidiomarina halalkaliphila]|uniref:DUF502 domain-containing protein n=1 Tax=Aliidiomarina halalkaliphila TaxID=2593535 RepID=A0A552X114_9GAMM|nr:DUF502 domain-containing protein [Aliidiomarina halalkaliphila]TRW48283.1 DUF502 domain-containing protein [Aliidiomarina halalkaliphila]